MLNNTYVWDVLDDWCDFKAFCNSLISLESSLIYQLWYLFIYLILHNSNVYYKTDKTMVNT